MTAEVDRRNITCRLVYRAICSAVVWSSVLVNEVARSGFGLSVSVGKSSDLTAAVTAYSRWPREEVGNYGCPGPFSG